MQQPNPLAEAFGRPTWRELRAPQEAAALRAAPVVLAAGEGQPVVIAPGFFGSEESLATMVSWLDSAGFEVRVAALERNVRGSGWAVDRIIEALDAAHGPAVLLGHSRGGQQARVATVRRPELVDRLITLGSPLRAAVPRHFVLRSAVESLRLASRLGVYWPTDLDDEAEYEADLFRPYVVPTPWTSIWSKSDGFVAWQACHDHTASNVEVDCSHRGLVESVPSFKAIADALR